MLRRANGEDSLFRSRFLFVASSTAKSEIETVKIERLLQTFGLPHVGMRRRTMIKRIYTAFNTLRVFVDKKVKSSLIHDLIAKGVHVLELPSGVDME
ncbi:unannotated protein [freshwater metagenome]|uniref:Unannotated protein n=1 Tax=freshwater metagenome TaxID=449393 RepID=A0A6J7JEY6_9ZZZZ